MINKLKWFWQRITRGFDDREVWDLFSYNAQAVLPKLKKFRQQTISSFPARLETLGEWQYILDKIIFSFEHIIIYDSYYPDLITANEYEELHIEIQDGLYLFAEYYFDLWN